MKKTIEYLDPKRKLVEVVAEWLCRAEHVITTAEGAHSLSHIMVVVPTAQSGRNLRLAIAKHFEKGILPPMVVQPMRLAVPENNICKVPSDAPGEKDQDIVCREATDAEVAAMFMKFSETRPIRQVENDKITEIKEWTHLFRPESFSDPEALFSFLDQLSDIWNILGAGGLLMGDVHADERAKQVLEEATGDESERWEELADLESAFFDFLHKHGLRHHAECIHLAKTMPKKLPPEIKLVVLPALSDPGPVLYDVLNNQREDLNVMVLIHSDKEDCAKFDDWGRPITDRWIGDNRPVLKGLTDEDIVCAASDTQLAIKIAADFPEADSSNEIPSVGLCDETLFPELAGAFLNGLCGEKQSAELSGSVTGKTYEIHNPARFKLSASSLGRIANRLVSLYACGDNPWPWDDFAALFREYDVLRHFTVRWKPKTDAKSGETAAPDVKSNEDERPLRHDVLNGLDAYRNAAFPAVVPQCGTFSMECFDQSDEHQKHDLADAQQFAKAAHGLADLICESRKHSRDAASFLRMALAAIYKGRKLGNWKKDVPDGNPESPEEVREREREDAEFSAAIEALLGVLSTFDSEAIINLDLGQSMLTALLRKELSNAVYSLEPDSDSGKVIMTEGWLELAWSGKGKIALAGFSEGAVPETVTGHVFLPDKLRAALGLPSNDSRLARDTFLLQSLVSSRKAHAVRVYFARTNNEGDIYRPSRLLFLVDDAGLRRRVKTLFGEMHSTNSRPGRVVAEDWRPNLPIEAQNIPPKGKDGNTPEWHLSTSSIDSWLKCPFAFFLKKELKMERLKEKEELEANDFGTLVHAVLEQYALEQLKRTARNEPQLSNEDDIREMLKEIFNKIRDKYGKSPSLKIQLQLDSVEARLRNFAAIQSYWAGNGWNVAAEPEFGFHVQPFKGEGDDLLDDVWIKGSVDRIDYKEGVGYRLIDYKTWDKKSKASEHVIKGGEDLIKHADALGIPKTDEKTKPKDKNEEPKSKSRRFLSIQLPLYGKCLETVDYSKFGGKIADYCYLILGRNAEETVFYGSSDTNASIYINGKQQKLSFNSSPKTILSSPELVKLALDTARIAIRRIKQGIFWPPGPGGELRYDLNDIILDSPEKDMKDSDWVKDQEKRLADIMPPVKSEGVTEEA